MVRISCLALCKCSRLCNRFWQRLCRRENNMDMDGSKPPTQYMSVHRLHGNGSVKVLCLHGYFGPTVFDRLIDRMAENRFTVANICLKGYDKESAESVNATDQLPQDSSVLLEDISIVLDFLRWEKCHLVGHSFGAGILLQYCNAVPPRVMSYLGIAPVLPVPWLFEPHRFQLPSLPKIDEDKESEVDKEIRLKKEEPVRVVLEYYTTYHTKLMERKARQAERERLRLLARRKQEALDKVLLKSPNTPSVAETEKTEAPVDNLTPKVEDCADTEGGMLVQENVESTAVAKWHPLFVEPVFSVRIGRSGVAVETLIPLEIHHVVSVAQALDRACPSTLIHELRTKYNAFVSTWYLDKFWENFNDPESIKDIDRRVLFVAGVDDPYCTIDYLKGALDLMMHTRNKTGVSVPKCSSIGTLGKPCGHLPMLTNTEGVLEIILTYLPPM